MPDSLLPINTVKNMFGQNTQILNSENHAQLRFQKAQDFSFAKNLTSAPLSVEEIIDAGLSFPVLFTAEGQVQAMALLGTHGNNFVNADNKWTAAYVPVHVRRYPFILGQEQGKTDALLMADLDAPQLQGNAGTPVFDEQGQIAKELQHFLELLVAFEKGRAPQHLQVLADENLLISQTLYKGQNQERVSLGQFRIVDEAKLHALSDEKLAKLAKSGVLALIYAHLMSLRNLKFI